MSRIASAKGARILNLHSCTVAHLPVVTGGPITRRKTQDLVILCVRG